MTVTKAQVTTAIQTIVAVTEAIRELGSVPSGELYARLMPTGMTLATYQSIIDEFKGAGLVHEHDHLLTWVEPEKKDDDSVCKADLVGTSGCECRDCRNRKLNRRMDDGR